MISASIVTTCKGRLHYLKDSLPSWLMQNVGPFISLDVIVVDFGCPDRVDRWCGTLDTSRVHVVKAVHSTEVFNVARARNIGGRASASEFLAFVDADIALRADFIRKYVGTMLQCASNICVAGSVIGGARHTSGLCVVERSTFEAVRGYDEAIDDYGEDDTDFYRRCDFAGFVRHWLEWDADHQVCSDEVRTRFYRCKDIAATIQRNVAQTLDPGRQVNPKEWGMI